MVEYKIELGLQEGQTVADIVGNIGKHRADRGLVNYAIWSEIGTIMSKLRTVTVIAPLIYRIQLPLHPLENGGLEVPAIELNGHIFATKKLLAAQIRNEALESLEDMVHTGVI